MHLNFFSARLELPVYAAVAILLLISQPLFGFFHEIYRWKDNEKPQLFMFTLFADSTLFNFNFENTKMLLYGQKTNFYSDF